ncbi:Arachidonate--CoA ligase [Apodemus speciosus]|uniref:Arachidonate--CoA ligase n=1 Tax=Apodemus speciosus TaxID=105296 RepID=A0ABQ0F9Z7_APOSI
MLTFFLVSGGTLWVFAEREAGSSRINSTTSSVPGACWKG